jgi:hypothetical protein
MRSPCSLCVPVSLLGDSRSVCLCASVVSLNFRFFFFVAHMATKDSDWLRAGRLRGRGSSPGRVKNFHFFMLSRPALGSTQPPIQWIPGALSRG